MARLLALLIGTFLALLIGTLLGGGVLSACDSIGQAIEHLGPRFGDAAQREAAARQETIDAEIEKLGATHPWAGSYYEGDGLGENVTLHLAPTTGFVFEWHGCTGLYDRNFGEVRESSEGLEFSFHFPNERNGWRGLDSTLVPVAWGPRRYLVVPAELKHFCRDVNSGSEPRLGSWGHYLLRVGDEEKAVSGLPALPEQFRKLLLPNAVEASIIRVGKSWKDENGSEQTQVTLDLHQQDGIVEGMQMRLVDPGTLKFLRITRVDRQECEAIIEDVGSPRLPPAVGWKFTSRAWDRSR